jgi:hypothetical protein
MNANTGEIEVIKDGNKDSWVRKGRRT